MKTRLERGIDWLRRDKYAGKETPAFRRDAERLRRGEPVDYVIGFADFLGCKVDLSARPLIPRPETEFWTEKIIASMRSTTYDPRRPCRILDAFCGSGAIGIAVLKHVPHAHVVFADIEPGYFSGIRKSLRWNGISARRASFRAADVLRGVGGAEKHAEKFDYILANPPYIPLRGRRVQASVRHYEPHAALFAGRDGLKFIRALLRQAPARLTRSGKLVLEFDPPQKAAIAALARRWRTDFRKDQYGRWRYAMLQK